MLAPSELTFFEEFAGGGGTSDGVRRVPGIRQTDAANHDEAACKAHEANFPGVRHWQEDITKLDIEEMPYATIFGGSPVCPPFSNASGVVVDFDQTNAQLPLFGDDQPEDEKLRKRREAYKRGRLLMHEPIRYLRAMKRRYGIPVLGGVIENVPQARGWAEWDAWIGEFHKEDYYTRLIAFNSMLAVPPKSPLVPQSRNRLYVMFWHKSLGRHPDFRKWLDPEAYCPSCDQNVQAVQVFKKPGVDMGNYGTQYVYRCPNVTCGHLELRPPSQPALTAIDPSLPGVRIGDREALGLPPLVPATIDRLMTGVGKFWLPLLDGPKPFGLSPFITPHRGGGDLGRARSIFDWVHTVTAGGNHHGIAFPPPVMRDFTAAPGARDRVNSIAVGDDQAFRWANQLLVPYYSNSKSAVPAARPVGTITTRPSCGLAQMGPGQLLGGQFSIQDVLFRMASLEEIRRFMGFPDSYIMPAGFTKATAQRLYGNACTPGAMELLYSCLAECISGVEYDRERRDFALAG